MTTSGRYGCPPGSGICHINASCPPPLLPGPGPAGTGSAHHGPPPLFAGAAAPFPGTGPTGTPGAVGATARRCRGFHHGRRAALPPEVPHHGGEQRHPPHATPPSPPSVSCKWSGGSVAAHGPPSSPPSAIPSASHPGSCGAVAAHGPALVPPRPAVPFSFSSRGRWSCGGLQGTAPSRCTTYRRPSAPPPARPAHVLQTLATAVP